MRGLQPIALACLAAMLLAVAGGGCVTARIEVGLVDLADSGRVSLRTRSQQLALSGPLTAELQRIPDAQVKVWGRGTPGGVAVLAYQILDVGNGFAATIGRLSVDQMGANLVEWSSGRRWRLAGVDAETLRAHHGAKIWVTGAEENAQQLRVLGWGVLSEE